MNPCNDRSPGASWLVAGLALLLATAAAAAAQAQPQQPPPPAPTGDGISVAGTGEVKAKPTAVEISATVSGDAELAADAIVKYRDTKRRAVEALQGLKLEAMKIDSGGFAINQGIDAAQQQAMMNGNAAGGGGKQHVTVSEQLTVTLGGLDKLKDEELMDTVLKLVDTGRDGGLEIGPRQPRNYYEMQMFYNSGRGDSSLVTFVIPDPDALRDQAYKAAMDDARKRAERLASLAGVRLGRILSVRDQPAPRMSNPMAQMYGMPAPANDSPEELSSGVFAEIPVRVNLAVQFEIAAGPAPGPRADAGDAAAVDGALADRAAVEKFWDKLEQEVAEERLAIRGVVERNGVGARVAEFRDRRKALEADGDLARVSAEHSGAVAERALKDAEATRASAAAEVERLRAELEKIKAEDAAAGEAAECE